jgi:hypothetical protein
LGAQGTGQKTAAATKTTSYSGLQDSQGVTLNDFSAMDMVENQCKEFSAWLENVSSVRLGHLLWCSEFAAPSNTTINPNFDSVMLLNSSMFCILTI